MRKSYKLKNKLAGILNAAQKKSTFNLDNLIEVYTFVVY
jgi:hypothetical protein